MADATADSTIFENEGSWVFFDEQLFTKALKPHVRQAIAVANEGSVLFPTDNELDVGLTDAELTEDLVFTETISVPINLDGVLSEGEVFKSLDVSINFDSEDTEVNEGGSLIGDDSVDFFLDNVITEGPWEAPWMPQDRSLSSLDGAFDVYPTAPHFYLNFDEPHDLPKRIKDGWQRGTEATYWDGEKLRTAAPNEPRVQVDPVTGERYLLAEPQRTNVLPYSNDFTQSEWAKAYVTVVQEGTILGEPAYKITDTSDNGAHKIWEKGYDGWHSVYVKKGTARYVELRTSGSYSKEYGTPNSRVTIDLQEEKVIDTRHFQSTRIIPYGNGVYRIISYVSRDSGNPDAHGIAFHILNNNAQAEYAGSGDLYAYIMGFQTEPFTSKEVVSFPTSLIKTNGSSSTRAPDDLSDLPFNMQSGAKSVYLRVSQEANGYGTNEGGNITNAEVNLTDTPGTAGGGMLRPSTGILGISASGWIDAVVNSTDEDLQGNSTSDVVDGLTIQPDKDPSTDGAIYRIHELVAWEEERTYDERRSLTDERPQPWQELDAPNINTLNDPEPWASLGINEPPHLHIDVPRYGIPARMVSAWQRGTTATYWDSNGVLQTAQPGEPRFQHNPVTGDALGMLGEGLRTNRISSPRGPDPNEGWSNRNGATRNTGKTGIDGTNSATELYNSDGGSNGLWVYNNVIPIDSFGYTWSFFLRKNQGNEFVFDATLKESGGGEFSKVSATINPNDGSLTYSNTQGIMKVRDCGDWWRVIATKNNDNSAKDRTDFKFRGISGGSGNGIIVDGLQFEKHGRISKDSNGRPIDVYPTMPILSGGATRDNDRFRLPLYGWPETSDSDAAGYIEVMQEAGETYGPPGDFNGYYGNGKWRNAYLNVAAGYGHSHGIFEEGTFGEGWTTRAKNTQDADNYRSGVRYLWFHPDISAGGRPDSSRFILRRLFAWPNRNFTSTQRQNLLNYDFSV